MKVLFNKIFIIIFVIIILIISFEFYLVSKSYKVDRNTYAILIRWNAVLINSWKTKALKINERKMVTTWDVISVVWRESLLVVEWWDKSITRLRWNSKILIKENFVSDDLDKIQISFELLKWKTWSHVISIMWDNSYFKEEIKGVLAAVRWTIFEADYEKEYVACHNHNVEIIKDQELKENLMSSDMFLLKENKKEYFNNLIDTNFVLLNEKLDKEYIEKLKKDFEEKFLTSNPFNMIYIYFKSFNNIEFKIIRDLNLKWKQINYLNDYISSLTEDEQKLVFNRLNKISQSINFANSWYLYDKKMLFREFLIENAPNDSFKQNLIKYSIFDLQNVLRSNTQIQNIKSTLKVISNYKDYIENNKDLVNNFWNFIKNLDINNINNNLKKIDYKWAQLLEWLINKFLEFNK